MVKIRNTLNKPLAVVNFKKFAAGEIREVSKEDANILIRNPFLEIYKKPGKKTTDSKKETNKNITE